MNTYIGVKLIEAKPMNLGEYNNYRGWDIPKDEDPEREGYLVKYSDDYSSWSPKDVFHSAYLKLEDPTRITPKVVDDFVTECNVVAKIGNHTVMDVKTKTGFNLIETSACVDPNNYCEDTGKEIATKRAKDKLWFGLGFVLAWAKNGVV